MASYETDHNIQPSNNSTTSNSRSRRLDLSSFYSHLEYVNPSSGSSTAPPPRQSDVSGAYRMLANAYQVMQGERTGVAATDDADSPADREHAEFLSQLIASAMHNAEHPPSQPDGVPASFFDELERVSKAEIKRLQLRSNEEMSCPICRLPFLEDEYPLVVRLRCSKLHLFDLECLQPWLKLNPTCPLDRQRLIPERKKTPFGAIELDTSHDASDEMTEEADDMYG